MLFVTASAVLSEQHKQYTTALENLNQQLQALEESRAQLQGVIEQADKPALEAVPKPSQNKT